MIYILNILRVEAHSHLLVDFYFFYFLFFHWDWLDVEVWSLPLWWWYKTNEDIFRMTKTLWHLFINDWQVLMTATFDCLLIFKGQSIMKCICSSLPDVLLYVNSHTEPRLIKFIHFTNSYIYYLNPICLWFSSIVTFVVCPNCRHAAVIIKHISFNLIENVSGH